MPTADARDSMGRDDEDGLSRLDHLIRSIPDWPKPGVVFKDITPLLGDPAGLALAVEYLARPFHGQGIELVTGAESRGFLGSHDRPERADAALATARGAQNAV